VDLNRNYPFNWDKDPNTDPESLYYKGLEPASQSETLTMINFFEREQFQLAIFYHTSATGAYSEKIYFPWKWDNDVSPDYPEMLYLARHMARNIPKAYNSGHYTVQTLNTSQQGFARDYVYSEHGTLSFLLEVAGNSQYGLGIYNPPNNVLKKIVKRHVEAAIKLVKEYDDNLLIGQVKDKENTSCNNFPFYLKEKIHPLKKNLKTNNYGYFFYYLHPQSAPYHLVMDDTEYSIKKTNKGREEISIFNDKTQSQSLWLNNLNNQEAIILLDNQFQYFAPLQLNPRKVESQSEFKLYLLKENGIRYSKIIPSDGYLLHVPWLPPNLDKLMTLIITPNKSNPLLDNDIIANKLLFLKHKEEKLTYAEEYNSLSSFYLQPHTQLGIDYSLYQPDETNYQMDSVTIYGNSSYVPKELEISLFDGAKLIYSSTNYIKDKDYITFPMPNISLPNRLFIAVKNKGNRPLSIYRQKNTIPLVTSKRTFVCYSQWQHLEGPDLAVTVSLKKR
jgi:hypothetical protein